MKRHCRNEKEIRELIAYAMATNPETNPEELPVEVFIEKLSTEPLTNELIAQWLEEKVEIPNYWNH